jgi:DNA-binding NarL/FixJ family response regulator
MAIRVFIADDYDAIREGVRKILSHDGIEVCGKATPRPELLMILAIREQVDVAPEQCHAFL